MLGSGIALRGDGGYGWHLHRRRTLPQGYRPVRHARRASTRLAIPWTRGSQAHGTTIVPRIWDNELADVRLGVPTEASYDWVRHLAAAGILIGPSGGAAVWGAVETAKTLERGVVVTILPDSGLRYLSDRHLWENPS